MILPGTSPEILTCLVLLGRVSARTATPLPLAFIRVRRPDAVVASMIPVKLMF